MAFWGPVCLIRRRAAFCALMVDFFFLFEKRRTMFDKRRNGTSSVPSKAVVRSILPQSFGFYTYISFFLLSDLDLSLCFNTPRKRGDMFFFFLVHNSTQSGHLFACSTNTFLLYQTSFLFL